MEEEAPAELGSFGFFTTLVWLDDELLELPGMAIVDPRGCWLHLIPPS